MRRASISHAAPSATFSCNVCGRAFNRPDHLDRHERAHGKSRPFRCGLCDKRFGRRDVLLRHSTQVHRGQRPSEYEHAQVNDAQESPATQSAIRCTDKLEWRETMTEVESTTSTEYIEPTREYIETEAGDMEFLATPPSLDTDPNLAKVTAFNEADLDDFLDLLVGIPSYSNVAQALGHGPPNHERISPWTGHHSSRRHSLFPTFQQEFHLPRTPRRISDCNVAQALPSFHQGLFLPDKSASSSPRTQTAVHPLPSMTQFTFDQLVYSYKRHSATIRPFLHFPTLDISLHALSGEGAPTTLAQGQSCTQWKRQPHRSLLLSILALGAICDQKEALALDLYHKTRKEILDWLSRLQRLGSEEAPPIDLIQAFINYVSCGTKFGDKFIEDLTVGHTASLKSLIRGMSLEMSTSRPLIPANSTAVMYSTNTASDWLEWVYYEERKRTFLTYFALMSSTLTYLDAVTTMDWREVRHRMPCSEPVWTAATPSAWRSAFKNETTQPFFATEVEALFTGVPSGHSPPNNSDSPVTATNSANAGTQAQASQTRNDYSCFILIAAIYRETWSQRLKNTVDINATQMALQQWQTNWFRLSPQDENQSLTPLLSCSLAMFDNTQLLMHLDVNEAKEALVSREHGRFCVTLPAFNLRLDSEGSGCSLLSSRDDWQQTYDIFFHVGQRVAFRHIALYSVNALELTFKFHSVSESDKVMPSITPHTGTAIFYCIQLLTSWICFFSNCLNRGLYANWLDGSDNSEEWQDVCLVQNILAFASNRKAQFNASFNVPSSPRTLHVANASRLATDLLDLHAHVLRSCNTWPAFKNLGDALKARSVIISEWLQLDDESRFEYSP